MGDDDSGKQAYRKTAFLKSGSGTTSTASLNLNITATGGTTMSNLARGAPVTGRDSEERMSSGSIPVVHIVGSESPANSGKTTAGNKKMTVFADALESIREYDPRDASTAVSATKKKVIAKPRGTVAMMKSAGMGQSQNLTESETSDQADSMDESKRPMSRASTAPKSTVDDILAATLGDTTTTELRGAPPIGVPHKVSFHSEVLNDKISKAYRRTGVPMSSARDSRFSASSMMSGGRPSFTGEFSSAASRASVSSARDTSALPPPPPPTTVPAPTPSSPKAVGFATGTELGEDVKEKYRKTGFVQPEPAKKSENTTAENATAAEGDEEEDEFQHYLRVRRAANPEYFGPQETEAAEEPPRRRSSLLASAGATDDAASSSSSSEEEEDTRGRLQSVVEDGTPDLGNTPVEGMTPATSDSEGSVKHAMKGDNQNAYEQEQEDPVALEAAIKAAAECGKNYDALPALDMAYYKRQTYFRDVNAHDECHDDSYADRRDHLEELGGFITQMHKELDTGHVPVEIPSKHQILAHRRSKRDSKAKGFALLGSTSFPHQAAQDSPGPALLSVSLSQAAPVGSAKLGSTSRELNMPPLIFVSGPSGQNARDKLVQLLVDDSEASLLDRLRRLGVSATSDTITGGTDQQKAGQPLFRMPFRLDRPSTQLKGSNASMRGSLVQPRIGAANKLSSTAGGTIMSGARTSLVQAGPSSGGAGRSSLVGGTAQLLRGGARPSVGLPVPAWYTVPGGQPQQGTTTRPQQIEASGIGTSYTLPARNQGPSTKAFMDSSSPADADEGASEEPLDFRERQTEIALRRADLIEESQNARNQILERHFDTVDEHFQENLLQAADGLNQGATTTATADYLLKRQLLVTDEAMGNTMMVIQRHGELLVEHGKLELDEHTEQMKQELTDTAQVLKQELMVEGSGLGASLQNLTSALRTSIHADGASAAAMQQLSHLSPGASASASRGNTVYEGEPETTSASIRNTAPADLGTIGSASRDVSFAYELVDSPSAGARSGKTLSSTWSSSIDRMGGKSAASSTASKSTTSPIIRSRGRSASVAAAGTGRSWRGRPESRLISSDPLAALGRSADFLSEREKMMKVLVQQVNSANSGSKVSRTTTSSRNPSRVKSGAQSARVLGANAGGAPASAAAVLTGDQVFGGNFGEGPKAHESLFRGSLRDNISLGDAPAGHWDHNTKVSYDDPTHITHAPTGISAKYNAQLVKEKQRDSPSSPPGGRRGSRNASPGPATGGGTADADVESGTLSPGAMVNRNEMEMSPMVGPRKVPGCNSVAMGIPLTRESTSTTQAYRASQEDRISAGGGPEDAGAQQQGFQDTAAADEESSGDEEHLDFMSAFKSQKEKAAAQAKRASAGGKRTSSTAKATRGNNRGSLVRGFSAPFDDARGGRMVAAEGEAASPSDSSEPIRGISMSRSTPALPPTAARRLSDSSGNTLASTGNRSSSSRPMMFISPPRSSSSLLNTPTFTMGGGGRTSSASLEAEIAAPTLDEVTRRREEAASAMSDVNNRLAQVTDDLDSNDPNVIAMRIRLQSLQRDLVLDKMAQKSGIAIALPARRSTTSSVPNLQISKRAEPNSGASSTSANLILDSLVRESKRKGSKLTLGNSNSIAVHHPNGKVSVHRPPKG
ncbi:unnamed protein product [Amoebophrya sp. A25]|nr:unnamed protein product [Amoebophrya sp. A25]|eukprot:GSA25T00018819001.1